MKSKIWLGVPALFVASLVGAQKAATPGSTSGATSGPPQSIPSFRPDQAPSGNVRSAPTAQPSADTATPLSSAVLRVTTKMVLVDVVVAGHDGKPVAGLRVDDFGILEDGSKQEIKAFGASVPPNSSETPTKHRVLPPGMFTNTSITPFHEHLTN